MILRSKHRVDYRKLHIGSMNSVGITGTADDVTISGANHSQTSGTDMAAENDNHVDLLAELEREKAELEAKERIASIRLDILKRKQNISSIEAQLKAAAAAR